MVATLVQLRWRITLNLLRTNLWAAIGLFLGTICSVGMLWPLLGRAIALGQAAASTATVVLGAVGAAVVIGWTVVPLIYSGMDSTLDPRAMAAWAAPSWRLTVGLAVAGACGVPGILTGLALLVPALTWVANGNAGAAVLAVVLAPAALATCVLLGRSVVVGIGAASSRRGRDLLAVVGFFIVMGFALLPSLVNNVLDSERLDLGGIAGIARVLGLTPFGWALVAPGYLAQGQATAAVALAVGALTLPLVLAPVWHRVVARVMTGPARTRGRSRAYTVSRHPGGAEAAAVDVLPWQRRLAHVSSGPTAAVAARCLRYWRSDPRYLVQMATVVIFGVLFALAISTNYDAVGTNVDFTPGQAPGVLFIIGLIVALMCGWMIHDDLAFDSTALWTHVSAGLPGRNDRLGRALAVAVWQLPLLIILLLVGGWLTGNWVQVPAYLGASLGVYGVALAWSSLTSVLLPYETNPPGESPMKARTSGTAFIAAIMQLLGVFVIVVACLPVLVPLIAVVVWEGWHWGWLLLVGGLLWGGGAAWGGTIVGGRLLDQRYVHVLATIRSWPGHDD
ncbi:transporter [Actinomyces sp.]|uniref:transporter n=1 Tax=Actinomyces sp. TaxID=29317 RepID=UPI0026DBF359|nr:transporter [Actinomyces sp.]MDO4899066.1 transporter [Actinomyces sp.]